MNNQNALYIETKEIHQFTLVLWHKGILNRYSYNSQKGKLSENLLPAIDALLKKNSLTLKDMHAILVFSGPGSYTSLRIGVTTANVLAWGLNIPIFSLTKQDDIQEFIQNPKVFKQKHFSRQVDAYYQQ